jgi:hypothetical protein
MWHRVTHKSDQRRVRCVKKSDCSWRHISIVQAIGVRISIDDFGTGDSSWGGAITIVVDVNSARDLHPTCLEMAPPLLEVNDGPMHAL